MDQDTKIFAVRDSGNGLQELAAQQLAAHQGVDLEEVTQPDITEKTKPAMGNGEPPGQRHTVPRDYALTEDGDGISADDQVPGAPTIPVPSELGNWLERAGGNGHPRNASQSQEVQAFVEWKSTLPAKQRSHTSQTTVGLAREEVDFALLEDGTLVELAEDPMQAGSTCFLVWKEGRASYGSEVKDRGRVLVPLCRNNEALRRVRLPRGVAPYEGLQPLFSQVAGLIASCVDLPEEELFVVSAFVLSTWFVDRLPTAPYLALVGLPQSGKTTLLQVLNLLCRRPLLTADITTAAFFDACSRLMPTLLIDEGGTHGSDRYLRHLLRMGTTRELVAMRKNQTFHAYGAKVICFVEPPLDEALSSRCIFIHLTETNRMDLRKPTDPLIVEKADLLQRRLLQFRVQNYHSLTLPAAQNVERFRPRARDLYSCLAAPLEGWRDLQFCVLRFLYDQDRGLQAPLTSAQSAVLATLFSITHEDPIAPGIRIGALAVEVNARLQATKAGMRLQPRKVGTVLTSLGFLNRGRTNQGWKVYIDGDAQTTLHELVARYGLEMKVRQPYRSWHSECPWCKEAMIRID